MFLSGPALAYGLIADASRVFLRDCPEALMMPRSNDVLVQAMGSLGPPSVSSTMLRLFVLEFGTLGARNRDYVVFETRCDWGLWREVGRNIPGLVSQSGISLPV